MSRYTGAHSLILGTSKDPHGAPPLSHHPRCRRCKSGKRIRAEVHMNSGLFARSALSHSFCRPAHRPGSPSGSPRRHPSTLPALQCLYLTTLVAVCLVFAGCGGGLVLNQSAINSLLSVPSDVTFGTVPVGQIATAAVPILNQSAVPIQIASLAVSGQTFSLGSALSLPISLAPGSTLQVQVQFDPTATGQATGQLTFTTDAKGSGSRVIHLNGSGGSSTTSALSALSCAASSIAAGASDDCTVTLSSAAPKSGVSISLASNSAALTVPATLTVPSGSTTASFQAIAASVTQAQSVTITASASSGSSTFAVQVNPLAGSTSTLAANAASIAFGNVPVNSSSTQSVVLTASGSASITVSTLAVSGTGFTLASTSLPVTLSPGQSLTINLNFAPSASGSATGQLAIASNATQDASILIPLSGSGSQYSVQLSWDAPTSSNDPIAGYHVYRAASSTGTYQFISSVSGSTTSTYQDSSVQSGASYTYEVRAVDTFGVESAPSNTSTASIP